MIDQAALDDLAAFARIEVEAHDLEPWAEMIGELGRSGVLTRDQVLWVIKLYNAYDDLGSAWAVYRRWPTPMEWAVAEDGQAVAEYNCTQERRNLRGGRVVVHLASYVGALDGRSQDAWVRRPLAGDTPEADFLRLLAWLRKVWGTGRQSAFEWAEFLAKAAGLPVTAGDAQLWESTGPRRSLQRIYGNPTPSLEWLNEKASHARDYLHSQGIPLAWEDFETVICDFNVMRDGRYYPGRHLAALAEEIEALPDPEDRRTLRAAFERVVPEGWRGIAPGIDKNLLPVYRDTGRLALPEGVR